MEMAKALPANLQPGPETTMDFRCVRNIRDRLAQTSTRGLLNNLIGEARSWDKLVQAYQSKSEAHCDCYSLLILCTAPQRECMWLLFS